MDLDKFTFSDKRIIEKSPGWTFLRIDLSNENEKNIAISKRYDVVGLPTLIFLDPRGELIEELTTSGYIDAQDLLKLMNKAEQNR